MNEYDLLGLNITDTPQGVTTSYNPDATKLLAEYRANQQKSILDQEKALREQEMRLAQRALIETKPQMDLTPLFAIADAYNKTNTAQSYRAPTDNQQKILALEDALQKRRDELTDNRQKLTENALKEKLGEMSMRSREATLKAMLNKKEEEPPKQNQAQAAGFAKRMVEADAQAKALAAGGFNRSSMLNAVQSALPAAFQSNAAKQYEQAEKNFISAVLRNESGAAISAQEYASEGDKYFPRAGDTPEVIAQKELARNDAIKTLQLEAGNKALGLIGQMEGARNSPLSKEPPKVAVPPSRERLMELKKKYGR
jgi:hypothetical protein